MHPSAKFSVTSRSLRKFSIASVVKRKLVFYGLAKI